MIIHGDSLEKLKEIESESVDLLCTDPPYGYSFMGKAWDKTLPDIGIFKECLRVLKPGAFSFVMSAPRSDVCARMMLMLEDAGFEIGFTPIYWTYASGFPKAMNIGKMVDKKARRDYVLAALELGFMPKSTASIRDWTVGEHAPSDKYWDQLKTVLSPEQWEQIERKVIATTKSTFGYQGKGNGERWDKGHKITEHATPQAKALDGSYGGFQPKPAVEVVIVAMKPLSEKTYVDQALKNGKGITWLDDCRVPISDEVDFEREQKDFDRMGYQGAQNSEGVKLYKPQGRFPANLLVSDDVLNDGTVQKSGKAVRRNSGGLNIHSIIEKPTMDDLGYADEGGYSRFFSLDAWAQTLPFLAVPKASKSEKNAGLDGFEEKQKWLKGGTGTGISDRENVMSKNVHPTVKPLKLMSYLITLGSRPGDVVLDPFLGSGTTAIAAKQLGREYIGIEREAEYVEIAKARVEAIVPTLL